MIAEHTEMQMRLRKIGLQAKSFGKFRGCVWKIGFLHQHGAEVVVQFRALRLQFDGAAHFADGDIEVSGKIQRAPERAMRLGIIRSESHCLARLKQCGFQVSFPNKRVSEIDVRLNERRL